MGKFWSAIAAALLSVNCSAPAGAGGRASVVPPSLAEGERSTGVIVEEVVHGSAAEEAGIRAGDRIIAIDGEAIRSAAQLDAKLSASDGRRLTIDIDRGGARLRVRAATRAMALNGGMVLGIVHWELRFGPSGDPGETYIPPPPMPPPPDPPPPIPPQ
jgi:membrane-associated protease RseP (regulator of RpoE activity)